MAKTKTKKKKQMAGLTPREQEVIKCLRRLSTEYVNDVRKKPVASKNLQETIDQIIYDIQPKMTTDYYHYIINNNIYGQTQETVLKNNIIELPRNIAKLMTPEFLQKTKTWNETESLLHTIPCFKTGVLKQTTDEEVTFIQWTTNNVDIDNHSIDITLQVYTQTILKDFDYNTWAPGPTINATMAFPEQGKFEMQINVDKSTTMSDLLKLVPPTKLKWSPFQSEIWKNSSLQIAYVQEKDWTKPDTESFYTRLIRDFMVSMTLINTILETNKPVSRTNKNTEHKPKIIPNFSQDAQDERKVRTINTINFLSKSVPHTPTEKSVIKYNIESWQTRGHLRHYKSGKTVWVQPSVHHRKALQNNKSEVAPTTLKFNTPVETN